MRVLVNALSTTNFSGQHVLLGHLSRIAKWTEGEHQYTVLYHSANQNMCRDLGSNVKWLEAPAYTANWAARAIWEQFALPGVAKNARADFMFTPSGTVVPSLRLPQVSYAMNPVPLIPGLAQGIIGKIKARVQKWGYKRAMRDAAMMIFLSEYMRQAYRENAGCREKASEVVYVGLDETVFRAAEALSSSVERKPNQIISVSVMAPHKGTETLVRAIDRVKRVHDIPVRLLVVGPWSNQDYERQIRQLITELNLEEDIEIKGYATREELNQFYAESMLFSLMSQSESFGIPAAEAQAFGTPVVSSNCCAVPEVCGKGGIYRSPGDVEGTAEAIAGLLSDTKKWNELSEAARQNATRYEWDKCSRQLLRMFDVVTV